MAHDQGGAVELSDDISDGECLAAAGDALKHLGALSVANAFNQLTDGFRLVAHGGKIGLEIEEHGDRYEFWIVGGC